MAVPARRQGVSNYRRRQRDYRHLRELPDSLLEDIGLTRDQVGGGRWFPFF